MNERKAKALLQSGLKTLSHEQRQALEVVDVDPARLAAQCSVLERRLREGRRWFLGVQIMLLLVGVTAWFYGRNPFSMAVFVILPGIAGALWEHQLEHNLFIFRVLVGMYSAEESKEVLKKAA